MANAAHTQNSDWRKHFAALASIGPDAELRPPPAERSAPGCALEPAREAEELIAAVPQTRPIELRPRRRAQLKVVSHARQFSQLILAQIVVCCNRWKDSNKLKTQLPDGIRRQRRRSADRTSGIPVPGAQLIFVALPILAIACYGVIRGRTLPLAIASNFSFLYAAFLGFSWYRIEGPPLQCKWPS